MRKAAFISGFLMRGQTTKRYVGECLPYSGSPEPARCTFHRFFFSKLSGLGLSYTPCQCFIYEDCLFSALE